MLPALSVEWIVSELGKWIGFRLTEETMKSLISSLKSAPRTFEEVCSFDRNIRRKAVDEIIEARGNVLSALNIIARMKDEEFSRSLEITKKELGGIRISIVFVKDLTNERKTSTNGVLYSDIALLSGCLAINKFSRDLLKKLRENQHRETLAILEEINEHIKNLKHLISVRSVAAEVSDQKFFQTLEVEHDNIYEAFRSLAVFRYSIDEEKKDFAKDEYYKKLLGRSLHVTKALDDRHKPVIELKEFYREFKKMNSDIEVSQEDLEKALRMLANQGWIEGIESSDGLRKVIVTRLKYGGVLELAKAFQGLLTVEDVVEETHLPIAHVERTLGHLEEMGVARKVIEHDGAVRWFFPGLVQPRELPAFPITIASSEELLKESLPLQMFTQLGLSESRASNLTRILQEEIENLLATKWGLQVNNDTTTMFVNSTFSLTQNVIQMLTKAQKRKKVPYIG